MSSCRLYVDEDAEQHALIDGLRKRGIDVLTAMDGGKIRQLEHLVATRTAEEMRDQIVFL